MDIFKIIEPMDEGIDEMFQNVEFSNIDFFLEFVLGSFSFSLFVEVHKDFIDEIQDGFIDSIIELIIQNKSKQAFYNCKTLGGVGFLVVFDWIEKELRDMLNQKTIWVFSQQRLHNDFNGTINFTAFKLS